MSGYVLNDRERDAIWNDFSRTYIAAAPPTDKPKLMLESMRVTDYGNNAALFVRFRSSMQRGDMRLSAVAFAGRKHIVVLGHAGTPENADEGISKRPASNSGGAVHKGIVRG